MVTLITWQTSSGKGGRCDAKCYTAEEPVCDCICCGRNHGAGRQQAEQNTYELAEGWAAHARAKGWLVELGEPATQASLFALTPGGSDD